MNGGIREEIIRISGVNPRKCMRCGKCTASCPSYDGMEYKPHEFVHMAETGEVEALLNSESVYKCLSCMACLERCPRGVEPSKIVEAVRVIAERKKGGNRLNTDGLPELIDDDMPQQALTCAMRKYSK